MVKNKLRKITLFCFASSLLFVYSCRKAIPTDELQGTWLEKSGENSKLIFSGDTFYFSHSTTNDTFSFNYDRKHLTLWTAPISKPTAAGKSYQVDYHKKKKILTVIGLFTTGFGEPSKNYFKKK
jgi:hypothetical protein